MDKDKKLILDEYVKYRRQRNHSDAINDIENHIKWFITFSKKPLTEYNEKILLDYLDKIRPKYKTSMLNAIKGSYLKNFIKWHFTDWSSRFRNLDILCRSEKSEATYKAEDMISETDFKKLIKAEESHFWKAYFLTLFYGGCRPIEVCNLKWENIEFEKDSGAYITIYSKKNKTDFIKYVPSDVAFYLNKLKNNNSEWVFLNPSTKKPVGKKGAYWKIRNLSQQVLGYKIDLYTLRHSIATIIYNKDDIKDDDIAKQMGHTKSMKGKYVHNNKNRLKEIAKRIYVSPEELPPEKKHELEMQIEELKRFREQDKKEQTHVIKLSRLMVDKELGNITTQDFMKGISKLIEQKTPVASLKQKDQ